MIGVDEALDILVFSVRDGFVQVSAFVALTVLVFGLVQYRSGGRLVEMLEQNERFQPLAGGLLGLTPGCGGAIVAMPLYIRGKVSFGTVVAALAATAGDSAFVILALAPEAALYAYAMAFVAGVAFGYMIDFWGMGVGRVDSAVERIGRPMTDGGFATTSVADGGPSISGSESPARGGSQAAACDHPHNHGTARGSPGIPFVSRAAVTKFTHAAHVVWWIAAVVGLAAGVEYLRRGAPEVALEFAPTFSGVFTVAGLTGTALSFYLYFVGRHYVGPGEAGRIRESFASAYDTFQHAAMETAMVTVWVIGAYLVYEYTMAIFALDIGALAAAAGILAPLAGAALGLIPGCAPQIVFATIYASGEVPFSALAANAISQDGDALFPLMAIDMKAAIIATIYTTVPAAAVGVGLHYFWPYAQFGFGVLG
ncbi:putative manganese transporter (plasmid) [Halorussus salilacus]|uniref:putative manganese transporter n=1 Tax=Halorussus salilacus TaxID=2953750 RepID=UPI00209C882C|nr:putative manganese transporter [Halorussus salilacus]USZ69947.1 putative manganese transporter [Halorussus salilacus]